jgi:toxin ParE1/3/4
VRVVFTQRAADDLRQIRDYIGLENPFAASRVAVELVSACDRLERFPERGRPGRVPGTRELLSVWPYVIAYRIQGDNVEILHVWHGAQPRD